MEAIGSEVGQKMRSAIKAKLMELGCYVDDELPDYVMVMVANKRTRSQMEDDLQLFLTNNTEAFVGWLHQVLQKLQEVTINTNIVSNAKKSKPKHSTDSSLKKDRKEKDKKREKDREKLKAKLKLKMKKSKKDKKPSSKETERIRPNVPPLLMNLEKESSPSITDVFAGQILKSHGIKSNSVISVSDVKNTVSVNSGETKSGRKLLNRNRFPIIDPNSVEQISEVDENPSNTDSFDIPSLTDISSGLPTSVLTGEPRAEKIKEINEINAKIQTLKKRLAEQMDSGSEDEDFINLRTEAEELMGVDFNEDPIVSAPEIITPPLHREGTPEKLSEFEEESLTPVKSPPPQKQRELIRAPEKSPLRTKVTMLELPQIELNLPKRPLRDRLGVRPNSITISNDRTTITRTVNMVNPYQSSKGKNEKHDSGASERMHAEKHSTSSNEKISVKSRLTLREEKTRTKDEANREENVIRKRIGSRIVPLPPRREEDPAVAVASIVRAPPRPTNLSGAPASQLLMRAVADAHKSLLSMPPKNTEAKPKKKALVLPMRRHVDPKKIIIEVSSDKVPSSNDYERRNSNSDLEIDIDTESLGDLESDGENRKNTDVTSEYVPEPLGRKLSNFKSVDYVPTHIETNSRTDGPVISRVLHFKTEIKKTSPKKDPQFVVTLDGLDPNIFLEKKLVKEKQENDKLDLDAKIDNSNENNDSDKKNTNGTDKTDSLKSKDNPLHRTNIKISLSSLNNNSLQKIELKTESVIEKSPSISTTNLECKKDDNVNLDEESAFSESKMQVGTKRKSEEICTTPSSHKESFSPIIFKDAENSNPKPISTAIDTTTTSKKYDSLPSLPPDKKRKSSLTPSIREPKCRFFPDCRLGAACEFYHPPATPSSLSPAPLCLSFPACAFGDNCAYGHPVCKFDKSCVRKGCPYTHSKVIKTKTKLVNQVSSITPSSPAVASRVVPVSNYKTISATPLPSICKFYPNCSNMSCHFFHPKPCRFGKFCLNKLECNFYHHDTVISTKWTSI